MGTLSSKILLVSWDSADWRLINPVLDVGAMPHLSALVDHGVIGDMGTLSPPLPNLLRASLLTGQRANRHGVLDHTESKNECRVPSLWHRLALTGIRSVAVGWNTAHAKEMPGAFVSETYPKPTAAPGDPWPLFPGTVIPGDLENSLAEFRVSPEEIDGTILKAFVPRAGEVDQERDNSLAAVAMLAAESLSIHAAATWLMENTAWDFAAIRYPSLGGFIARFLSAHGNLESLYGEVISGALRFHDLFLGTLRHLAGSDATILLCSEHGSSQVNQSPVTSGLAYLHRSPGIFCAAGPGIRRDERIDGVGLLDIAPTILQLFGQPIASDLEGCVLAEAFRVSPEIKIEPVAAISDVSAETLTEREKWNLIHVYLETSRPQKARILLEELYALHPDEADVALLFALAQMQLGKPDVATLILDRLARPDLHQVRFLRTRIAFQERRFSDAQEMLRQLAIEEPTNVSVIVQIGLVYLAQHMDQEAARAFRNALELRSDLPTAHVGMAKIHLRQRRFPYAADSALRALRYQYHLPQAHYCLGVALYALEMLDRAALAFETSLCFPAHLWRAHGWLAHIFRRQGLTDRAEHHRELWKKGLTRRRQLAADLAAANDYTRLAESFNEKPPVSDMHPLLVLTGLPHPGIHKIARLLELGGLQIILEQNQLSDPHFAVNERTVLLIPYKLLPQLPKTQLIRVIVSDCRVEEVIAFKRNNQAAQKIRPPRNKALESDFLRLERDASLKALCEGENFRTLIVDLETPEISEWIERIQEFLAPLSLDLGAMRDAVYFKPFD